MDENRNKTIDNGEIGVTPPPLADPVVTAIFQDASVSGLAMKSLLNASLADSGDALISDIINERSLLYSEQSLSGGARRGDKLNIVTANMPRVIVLNILDFVLRPSGKNFHQVAELTYREEPRERAVKKYEIHHLQLPRFMELEPNFKNPLHCWLTAICRAQEQKVFLKGVVDMEAALKAYYDIDPGFAQFVDRHGYVASLPQVRKEYKLWQIEQVVRGEEDARIEAKGKAEGRTERDMEIALKAYERVGYGMKLSVVTKTLRDFGISEDVIQAARERSDNEFVRNPQSRSDPER